MNSSQDCLSWGWTVTLHTNEVTVTGSFFWELVMVQYMRKGIVGLATFLVHTTGSSFAQEVIVELFL
jgi:hypothetical protein